MYFNIFVIYCKHLSIIYYDILRYIHIFWNIDNMLTIYLIYPHICAIYEYIEYEGSYLKTSSSAKEILKLDLSRSIRDMKILKLGSFRASFGLYFSAKILVNKCWPKVWIFRIYAKIRGKKRSFSWLWKMVGGFLQFEW